MKDGVVIIHGREYLTVARRVNDFRKNHPVESGWSIMTEIIEATDDCVIMKAVIIDPSGKVVATGFSEEWRGSSKINQTSALENAETSAIGRALAAAGWLGVEYASANEVEQAKTQQDQEQAKKEVDLLDLPVEKMEIRLVPDAYLPEEFRGKGKEITLKRFFTDRSLRFGEGEKYWIRQYRHFGEAWQTERGKAIAERMKGKYPGDANADKT